MTFNSSLLSSQLNLLSGGQKLEFTRPAPISYDSLGKPFTLKSDERFTIIGNVQPVTGNKILQVPEGDRTSRNLFVYTRSLLKVDDVMQFEGENFEVQDVENWQSYIKARAVLADVGRSKRTKKNRR